jgi:hypothetical protein
LSPAKCLVMMRKLGLNYFFGCWMSLFTEIRLFHQQGSPIW